MTSRFLRSVGFASVVALVAGSAAACGGGGGHGGSAAASGTPASVAGSGSASAAPSTSSPAAGSSTAPVSAEQLAALAYAFGKTHAAGLKEIADEAAEGVNDEKAKASSGGATCETFLNASQAYASTYGSTAEVDRGYEATTTLGDEHLEVSLISHTSPATARRTVEDTRTSAEHCPHVTVAADGTTEPMHLTAVTAHTMGDDSAVVRIGTTQNGTPQLTTLDMAQVGSITIHVFDISAEQYDQGVADEVANGLATEVKTLHPAR